MLEQRRACRVAGGGGSGTELWVRARFGASIPVPISSDGETEMCSSVFLCIIVCHAVKQTIQTNVKTTAQSKIYRPNFILNILYFSPQPSGNLQKTSSDPCGVQDPQFKNHWARTSVLMNGILRS